MAWSNPKPRRKKVAIVGSGSAGIASLWALNRTHHDVFLYEGSGRLGGQTNAVEWKHGKFKTLVDTGFMTINSNAYPNFLAFLNKIGLRTVPVDMSVGLFRDDGSQAFAWMDTSLKTIFTQWTSLLSPRTWRVGFDMVRFNQFALDVLIQAEATRRHSTDRECADEIDVGGVETIGQYLQKEGYSDAFLNDYLMPLTVAIWGTSAYATWLDLPAVTLIRFLWDHQLLSTVGSRPKWLTMLDGSKGYIDAVLKGFPSNHLFLNTAVKSLANEEDGRVRLQLENGKSAVYDHVILATHGDDAYSIIQASATEEEFRIMSKFRTSSNTAVLHSDRSLMPGSRRAWSSCNYLSLPPSKAGGGAGPTRQAVLTYHLNTLQRIPPDHFGDVLVTLNPIYGRGPADQTVQGRYSYRQPLNNAAALWAQHLLPRIQNTRGISYAGAWTRHGTHEDGFSSGLQVAQEHLGAKLPFRLRGSTFGQERKPELGLADYTARLIILIVQLFFVDLMAKVSLGSGWKASRAALGPYLYRSNRLEKSRKLC